jgi:ketosteroid isomerase-like protein
VKAVLDVVTEDVVVVGSDPGESAFGRSALPAFLQHIFSTLPPIEWKWEHWETRGEGDHAWFFVEGIVGLGGEIQAYRASGVCRRDELGEWRLAMFHGSSPTE